MAVKIRCYGKVQGVFYRASTKSEAEDLGITGWVINEPDGTVLIHAEGAQDSLKKLIEWTKKGPDFAVVRNVVSWPENDEGFEGFEIRR